MATSLEETGSATSLEETDKCFGFHCSFALKTRPIMKEILNG